jgi:hypothetical protein
MKKIISLILVVIMMFSLGIVTFADPSENNIDNDNVEMDKELKELVKKYDLKVYGKSKDRKDVYRTTTDGELEFIELESIDELEKFIKKEKKEKERVIKKTYEVQVPKTNDGEIGILSLQHTRQFKEWAPYFNGALLCWHHIFTTYTYDGTGEEPKFISVDDIDSDVTGLQIAATYYHKSSNSSFYNDMNGCNSEATGKMVLGISIKGWDIGASFFRTIEDRFVLVYE